MAKSEAIEIIIRQEKRENKSHRQRETSRAEPSRDHWGAQMSLVSRSTKRRQEKEGDCQ